MSTNRYNLPSYPAKQVPSVGDRGKGTELREASVCSMNPLLSLSHCRQGYFPNRWLSEVAMQATPRVSLGWLDWIVPVPKTWEWSDWVVWVFGEGYSPKYTVQIGGKVRLFPLTVQRTVGSTADEDAAEIPLFPVGRQRRRRRKVDCQSGRLEEKLGMHRTQTRLFPFFALLGMVLCTGCSSLAIRDPLDGGPGGYFDIPDNEKALLPEAMNVHTPARELDKVAMAEYRIAPPDSLSLSSLSFIPKEPYIVQPLDILSVNSVGTFEAEPVQGPYQVDTDGYVSLGASYGRVRVAGQTIKEAENSILRQLSITLGRPAVSITLLQTASTTQIDGEHFVSQDGFISLGTFGRVFVTGLTTSEAREKIEKHLAQYIAEPKVGVEVVSFNSQRYFIVLQGTSTGDRTVQVPVTGNETVLDAISQLGELPRISSKRIWVARPSVDGTCDQVMPVDWKNVVRNASHHTNYQLFPNDRVYVAEDRLLRVDAMVARLTAPIEPIFGPALLGTQAIQSANRFPAGTNLGAGFF